jgi:virginiamycin B lyase
VKRPRSVLLAAFLVSTFALSVAQAAPLGMLKQFKVPTANSQPRHITAGIDGNLWFTEGNPTIVDNMEVARIGRMTTAGDITEFDVICFCFPNDIVQGPGNTLYFTSNNSGLGRITTAGEVQPFVVPVDDQGNEITDALGNGIASDGTDVWYADQINDSLWRFTPGSGFTRFDVPAPVESPFDVTLDANGIVWFTDFGERYIGRLDPGTGAFSKTPIPNPGNGGPRFIAIATDGMVWFTEILPDRIGRLDPANNQVTQFPTVTADSRPTDIAAAPDGNLWFTQGAAGNIARISPTGVIDEAKVVKGSDPLGITIAPGGNPWYAETAVNKIATLRL